MIKLRKEERLLIEGKYEDIDIEDRNVYIYKRFLENEELLIIANFYEKEHTVKLKENLSEYNLLISNYEDLKIDNFHELNLRPYESVMLKKLK